MFYCSQFNAGATPPVNHCKGGMVGVINGLGNRTFEAYKNLGKEVTTVGSPSGGPKGGSFEALQATTPSPSSGPGGASTTPSGTPSGTSSTAQPSTSKTGSGAGRMGASFGALAAAGAFAAGLAF